MIQIKKETLKEFKKTLKELLRENPVDQYKFRIKKNSVWYEAQLKGSLLILYVPGSKEIDGIPVHISFLSIKRKRHTLAVFLSKRIETDQPPPDLPPNPGY